MPVAVRSPTNVAPPPGASEYVSSTSEIVAGPGVFPCSDNGGDDRRESNDIGVIVSTRRAPIVYGSKLPAITEPGLGLA
jgi:hypothetical protein